MNSRPLGSLFKVWVRLIMRYLQFNFQIFIIKKNYYTKKINSTWLGWVLDSESEVSVCLYLFIIF